MIDRILVNCDEAANQKVKEVARWKLKSTENFLESLLKNRQDVIAAEFGAFYFQNATQDLLKFAINNHNEQFLK